MTYKEKKSTWKCTNSAIKPDDKLRYHIVFTEDDEKSYKHPIDPERIKMR